MKNKFVQFGTLVVLLIVALQAAEPGTDQESTAISEQRIS